MGKTICFDFDGVIHSYKSGWKGFDVIPDEPVDIINMKKELTRLKDLGYKLVIFSSRCSDQNGRKAIKEWLFYWDLEAFFDDVCESKPPAMAYVDDRAITFNGRWRDLTNEILTFKSWFE